MRVIKCIISVVLIIAIAIPCVTVSASAETTESAKIYSLVPDSENYYPGAEDYIAECLREKQSIIDVSGYGISPEDMPDVFKSAVFGNPDIFYVDAAQIDYKFNTLTNVVYYITPTYIISRNKIDSYVKKFNKTVNSFMSDIDSNLSDFKKALLIHDKMIVNCRYKSGSDLGYTAYGALVKKKAVCEGYSRAYCYLLSKVGLESKCINNEKKEHCWNYVKINDKWYHTDVTSDDLTPDTCGLVSHKYFLLSDSKLSSYKSDEHTGYKSDITYDSAYKCSSTKYNSSFFRKIESQIILYNNCYYYINNKFKKKNYSVLIKQNGSSKKAVKVIKTPWYSKTGGIYKNSFSRLVYLDGFIYFNSSRMIFRYKVKNGKTKKIFEMPKFWKNEFYGIGNNGRYIVTNKKRIVTKSSPISKTLYIRSNQSVLQIPFIRYSAVKMKIKQKYTFKVYKGSGKTTFKSSDSRIAKVSSKGVVKALKKGTCTVTALKNSRKFKLKVKVVK